ncbi:hypothetical protein LTR56_025636 [Elasticomyces elasticus]|nr:hypothetical protein LTR56_025636 [Elasticomyces elasticus]KAK3632176.1 hypothetical protein LTR22_020688 [Elasticomyces elasticus]KAK4904205.1 hypothetical protein LTR49_026295 [Elasticomyces elasticus]KAK5739460.1 hypothetical protein LTS12_025281 [Elasticomyces elasticus]
MADIAFGVVGVAGLAIQLADSVKKLQAFAVLVKDAPTELHELIEYINTSREWLDSITSTLVPAIDPALRSRCVSLCRKAVEKIAVVAWELEQGMQTQKRRTAMKLAWNTDGMERLRKRLDSSKLDLHFAHSIFESEQLRAEVLHQGRLSRDTMVDLNLEAYTRHQDLQQGVFQSINGVRQATQQSFDRLQSGQSLLQHEVQKSHFAQQQNLSTLRTGQARMEQVLHTEQAQTRQDIRGEASAITGYLISHQHQTIAHLDLFKQEMLDAVRAQSGAVYNAPVGSVVNSPQTKRRQRALHKSTYRLRLLSHGLELLIGREICGWNFYMKTYRVIPHHDDRWEPLRSRDLAGIQRAIHEGVISPYDRDEHGDSPIDLVMMFWAYGNKCEVFIEKLLDMWAHAGFPVFTNDVNTMVATITTLWAHEQRNPTSCDLVRKWYRLASLAQNVPEVMPEALADLPGTWPDEERFEVLSWMQWAVHDAVFDIVYGFTSFSPQLLAMRGLNGFSLIHAFAVSGPYRISADAWGLRLREFFESCVCFGADLHPRWRDRSGEDQTPLAVMLYKFAGGDYPEIHKKAVQQWLGALYLANVDLEEYGRAEMDLLRKLRGTANYFSRPCVPSLVAYGPRPEDWEFLEMHLGDIYAGRFWHMVGHPEASIPGAWLDDEDQAVEIEDRFVDRVQRARSQRREKWERQEEYDRQKIFERVQSQNRVDVDEEEEQRSQQGV